MNDGQPRSEGENSFHRLSQQEEASPTKAGELQHFPVVLGNNCRFLSSRQENDRLHTKRLKIAERLIFFPTFSQLLSTEPLSETAVDSCRSVRRKIKIRGSKIRREKRRCRKTQFSPMGLFHFFPHLKKKSNYCCPSVNSSTQTSAGNVILSTDIFHE